MRTPSQVCFFFKLIYTAILLMLQSMLAAHKFLSNLFQLFSPSRFTTREKFSSRQRQKKRMFILLCLGKAYLLSCCSELYLQSTTTKPSALIAVAQVEYLLSTLKYEAPLMWDLSNISEPHRRRLLFNHHHYFIPAIFYKNKRKEKNLSDFSLIALPFSGKDC